MRIQPTLIVGSILLLTIASQLAAVSIPTTDPSSNTDLKATDRPAGQKFVGVAAQKSKPKAVASTFTESHDVDRCDEDVNEDEDDDDDEDDDEDWYDDEDEDDEYDDDDYKDDFEDDELDGMADVTLINSTCPANSNNPILQKRDQVSGSSIMAESDTNTDETVLSAEATAEPGGACIDSVVNFALRFRERCTINCLKTMTHIFVKPDVLGLFNCFGCSNFLVSGIYALGLDCIGIFTSPAKAYPPIGSNATAPTTSAVDSIVSEGNAITEDQPRFDSEEMDQKESATTHPADAGLPAFDLNSVIGSLAKVNMSDVQNWFDIGMNVAQVFQGGEQPAAEKEMADAATSPAFTAPSGSFTLKDAETVEGPGQAKVQQGPFVPMDKKTFNQYVLKAASFADWKLTPEMLETSGAYDRAQAAGFV